MSELTSYYYYEDRVITPATHQYRVYHADEADKVIAELNAQVGFLKTTHGSCGSCNRCADGMGKVFDENLDKLKADYRKACDRLQTANLIKDEQIAATRHSKRKRCLAMAERCKYRMYYLAAVVEQEASKIIPLKAQIQWYQKRESRMDYWKNRWLELAERFKEEAK